MYYLPRKQRGGNMHQVEAENLVIAQALLILSRRCAAGQQLSSPAAVKEYLMIRAGLHQREVFGCVFLNAQNCVLACEDLFAVSVSTMPVAALVNFSL